VVWYYLFQRNGIHHSQPIIRMSPVLLQTKIQIPPLQPQLVSRPALTRRLDEAISHGHRLILVSAPAGFGKTTLLNEWVHTIADRLTVAWLSLDIDDNLPIRFWTYLISALQVIDGELGRDELKYLRSNPELPSIIAMHNPVPDRYRQRIEPEESILNPLLNQIAALPNRLILVLDDYHQITHSDIHAGVAYLLDHLPPQVTLVVLSRIDPSLPVVPLRARRQLTELRAVDLSFSLHEAAQFMNQLTGRDLSSQNIQSLEMRTEGWAVGLQMAGLTIQSLLTGLPDKSDEQLDRAVSEFINSFSGKHHFVLDYLAEEVLQRQPDYIQEFLLKTSILQQLNGPLCDYVTQGAISVPSQDILHRLEQSNLFVLPLDVERGWYRYHHLFSELLYYRLREVYPDQIAPLHCRASAWYETNKDIKQAIYHSIEGQDRSCAARLLEQHAGDLLRQGELDRVIKWFGSIPPDVVCSRPRLCLQQAWVLTYANQLQSIEPALQSVEQGLKAENRSDQEMSQAEEQKILAEVASIRAFATMSAGNRSGALEIALRAINMMPESCQTERSFLYWIAGFASSVLCDYPKAISYLNQAVHFARSTGNLLIVMMALSDLASVYLVQAKLQRAEATLRDALRVAAESGAGDHGYLSRVDASLADILREQNHLEEALGFAKSGVAKTRRWQNSNHIAWTNIQLARVLQASGDLKGAGDALEQAEAASQAPSILPGIHTTLESCRVRLWLTQDAKNPLKYWAEEFGAALRDHPELFQPKIEAEESKLLTYARVLMNRRDAPENELVRSLDEVLDILARLETVAQSNGRVRSLIDIYMLLARNHYQRTALQPTKEKQTEMLGTALDDLEKSLALASGEEFVRVYLDEGEVLKNLLAAAYRRPASSAQKIEISKLLAAFHATVEADGAPRKRGKIAGPEENISQRELEILRLVAAGQSSQEIARQLVLSSGTVKAHLANIYSKLDVHSRAQAIAVARALDLLE
jgi:LuxR family transcriptional regulator, maltose regulon positive regulatory protein